MKYRKLGNSGTVVSRLALGTMYFGKETPEADAHAILDGFVEAGGTLVDTADVYAENEAEKIIGRWFASRPKDFTDCVVLATKGRNGGDPAEENGAGLSRRFLHRSLDASLTRLGVGTIDLYQLHAADMETPVEETLLFLDDAVRAGKIHYVGLSNFKGWQVQLMVSTAEAMGLHVPVSIQPQYSLLSRLTEWEVLPAARHKGLAILPWSPLAGGLLSGKYDRGREPAPATRATSDNPIYSWAQTDYAKSDRNWATIDAVERIAREIGATPAQVALAWIADRPGVVAPIFGVRTVEQLRDNLGAGDLVLDDTMTTTLEEVSRPVAESYPYDAFGIGQRWREVKDDSCEFVQPYLKDADGPARNA